MAKKVLVISSSPVYKGNSDTLCDSFVKGAIETGNEVEKVSLRDKKIGYCTGCGFCSSNDYIGCSIKDDMPQLLTKMIESDVIVFATPVYFYTMCGQMKTFIDRCCAKYTKINNKEFYFILTAADTNADALDRTVEEFRGFLECLEEPKERGILYATGVWKKGEVASTKYPAIAYEMGKSV